tara:strand:+ start:147 stop:587 length:441 start_codon:yes stop_codon:yes gene_type:complete
LSNLIRFKGLKEAISKNEKRGKDAAKELKISMHRATSVVEAHVLKSIKQKGTGRVYPRKGQPPHQASSAGQPPATDTGNLGNNISSSVKGRADGAVVGQIIAATEYAVHLEFGTSQMAARPFMTPALRQNRKKINKIFKEHGVIKK